MTSYGLLYDANQVSSIQLTDRLPLKLQSGDGICSIEFVRNGERSRKVVGRSNSRPTGRYPSFRMKRMIQWDSPHELNAYRLLDSNPNVLEFSEQPCIIHYRLNGVEHRHYPDSLVRTKNGKTLWEVKTTADASKHDIAARTRLMTQQLPAYGYHYVVALAEDLRREPRLKNVRLLLRLGRTALTFDQIEFTRRLMGRTDALTWGEVLAGRYSPFTIEQACRLVLDNVLNLNLDVQIDAATILSKTDATHFFGASHV